MFRKPGLYDGGPILRPELALFAKSGGTTLTDRAMNGSLALEQGAVVPASAVDTALKAAQDGASDAMDAARQFLPAAGRFLSRAGYNSGYAVSYGVVFPAVLIARLFPGENAVAYGLADGARAGLDMARKSREKVPIATEPPADEASSFPAP